jgi:DNA repair protein RecO (recombination protein O)
MATSERGARSPLPAYVLHRHDWSETSLIVELFTRALGRVAVVAKGAKRPTSNLRPVLLPFQPIVVALGKPAADAQAELLNLRGAEWTGGAPLLVPARLPAGFHLNELLLRGLARQDPHPALFDAYADTLAALGRGEAEAPALRAFELLLLRETGVLPELDRQTQTAEPLQAEARYALDAEAGLRRARGDAAVPTGGEWTLIAAALSRDDHRALREACAPVAAGLRDGLRGLLHYHLGTSRMHTREVWQGLRRLADTLPATAAARA